MAAQLAPLPPIEPGYEAREAALVDAARTLLHAGRSLVVWRDRAAGRHQRIERGPNGRYVLSAFAPRGEIELRELLPEIARWIVTKAVREGSIEMQDDWLAAAGIDPVALRTANVPAS